MSLFALNVFFHDDDLLHSYYPLREHTNLNMDMNHMADFPL